MEDKKEQCPFMKCKEDGFPSMNKWCDKVDECKEKENE